MSSDPALDEKCATLRGLHRRGHPLVLPNAWDVASARAVADAGFPVIATSSGAVAAGLGHADHEGAPGDEMLAVAARIAAAVPLPVTVDAEAGYGWAADELVERLHAAGAAGANLEDTDHRSGALRSMTDQVTRLRAVRDAADRLSYALLLNARVDVFIAGRGTDQALLVDDAIARASAYLAAGADCVYPILLSDVASRQRLLDEVDGAVNLLTWPGGASVAELAAAGAARISYGTGLFTAAMAAVNDLLRVIADK
jgi:2-methylisocitrate lyase-like PEP mutase family enzyme